MMLSGMFVRSAFFKTAARTSRFGLIIALATTSMACGGGGGSTTAPPNILAGVDGGVSSVSGGQVSATNGEELASAVLGNDLTTLVDVAVNSRQGESAFGQSRSALTRAAVTEPCSGGGNVEITEQIKNPDRNTVGDHAVIVANACRVFDLGGTITQTGELSFVMSRVDGGFALGGDKGTIGADVSFNNFRAEVDRAGAKHSVELAGSLALLVENSVVQTRVSLTAEELRAVTVRDSKRLEATLRKLKQVRTTTSAANTYQLEIAYEIDLVSPSLPALNGRYVVTTTVPLSGVDGDFNFLDSSPTRGTIMIKGASKGVLTLEALTGGYVVLTIDENGDGQPEQAPKTLKWSDLGA